MAPKHIKKGKITMILYLNEKNLNDNAHAPSNTDALNTNLTVIAPAMDVILTQVKLPKLTRSRLLQALPFALEEQLLSDTQELHYAIGAQLPDGKLPVAIVAKNTLEHWLNLLNTHKLSPTSLIPAPLSLATPEAQEWLAVIIDDSVIVRTGLYSGFACDLDNFSNFLAFKYQEEAEKPTTINIRNYSNTACTTEHPDLIFKVEHFPSAQFQKDLILWAKPTPINLLQNGYRVKRKTVNDNKLWRIIGYVTAGWIGLAFLNPIISFFLLRHENETLEAQIAAIYYQHFPHTNTVVAPKKRMTQKLNSLITQGNKNPFLVWLAYVAETSAQFKYVKLQQIDYRDGQLNLNISAPNFDSLDRYAQALAQHPFSVKQHNIAASGSEVKGNLLITGSTHT